MCKNMAQNLDVVYVSDIVKRFSASAQALSKHLRTCENKGYIERVNDKVNRRNVMINLTDKGEKVFEITTQEFVLLKNKVFEKIDIDEFREAIKKMFEFREVLSATILGVGGAVKALENSKELSWIIIVSLSAIVILIVFIFLVAMPKMTLMQKLVDKLNLVSRENIEGMLVTRAFNSQNFEFKRFDKANGDLKDTGT